MHQKDQVNRSTNLSPANGPTPDADKNYVHLQQMISDSCSFYEKMEKQNEGSIEKMLNDLRTKIDKGRIKIDKRDQYDPNR